VQQESQPVTIVQISPEKAAVELSMIDVAVAAFGLTGAIMVAAIVAGITAGGLFIWYRSRHAITRIEAQGHQHNLFRTNASSDPATPSSPGSSTTGGIS
jgi:hypothetical protein